MGFETNINTTIRHYNKRLDDIGHRGIPAAAAGTLDNMAFESRKISIKTFENKYVIRSNWTQRGMLFEKTKRGVPIARMESRAGNVRDYASTLEEGDTLTADNEFIPIPALGSRIAKKRNRRIAKRFNLRQLPRVRRLPNIQGTVKRRFTAMLNIARKENYFGPFMITKEEAGSEKVPVGIFNLAAAGRKRRSGGKIVMLRKLQRSVKVPSEPFIGPSGIRMGQRMDRIYIRQAKRTLARFSRDIRR